MERACTSVNSAADADGPDGRFVPAREATIGLADRIFTRVGANDELSRAQSTFMVEMTETANILNNASHQPGDPGRDRPGTSTYDGVSIAWGVTEYLHDVIGCRALFATHYHELAQLAEALTRFRNYNAQVHEGPEGIVFLHRIAPGSTDKSYGIHVAQRAGVPNPVLERAREVLAELEKHHLQTPKRQGARLRRQRIIQTSLFANSQDPVLRRAVARPVAPQSRGGCRRGAPLSSASWGGNFFPFYPSC